MVDDPLLRFQEDRRKARDAKDPMAAVCVLATVDEDGLPQARTLVLRDIGKVSPFTSMPAAQSGNKCRV